MSSLAPLLERFFTERLVQQRRASAHTIASYRDTFRLLLKFIAIREGTLPMQVALDDVDVKLVSAFLSHLESARKNTARTRNARLAALHSFFQFVSFEAPEHSAQAQRVLAIPQKRTEKKLISFLQPFEADALLAAVDQHAPRGRRDHALILLAIETGLRVSEITQLHWRDVQLDKAAHVRCLGNGRKERCTPLSKAAVAALRSLARGSPPKATQPVFASRGGGVMSRDSVERLITKYQTLAAELCPSLRKKRISPHSLRHTSAMRLLAAGVERSVIALWLGHESIETTEIYLHADMQMKEKAIGKTAPLSVRHSRYRAPDSLLAFLEGL